MTLKKLRDHPDTHGNPRHFISSLDSDDHEGQGLRLSAVDYITKPFNPGIVLARIKTQLELKQARDRLHNQNQWLEAEVNRRVQENLLIQDVALTSLTQLAEARDDNTGNHILRTCTYIEILARQLMNQPRYAAELTEQKSGRLSRPPPCMISARLVSRTLFCSSLANCLLENSTSSRHIARLVPGSCWLKTTRPTRK